MIFAPWSWGANALEDSTSPAFTSLVSVVKESLHPLTGSVSDYDPLLDWLSDTEIVLLGETTHGSKEFYAARARITQRLIREKQFTAVAIEGSWPDALAVNTYVTSDQRAEHDTALEKFDHYPHWMWRNQEVLDFIRWLRAYNAAQPMGARVGFYGLDLLNLYGAIDAVLDHFQTAHPTMAPAAAKLYGCFDHYQRTPELYGRSAVQDPTLSCRAASAELSAKLIELDRELEHDPAHFSALQNARVVQKAEAYYWLIAASDFTQSWNLRDRHMVDLIETLRKQIAHRQQPPKMIVWAHNSHVGDARATAWSQNGQLSLGQLVREKYGSQVALVGFTTHKGFVAASSNWGQTVECKTLRPSSPDSYAHLFHQTQAGRFYLIFDRAPLLAQLLRLDRLHRAVGVVYLPETEMQHHYTHSRITDQFDAVIHFDTTSAVTPLDLYETWSSCN